MVNPVRPMLGRKYLIPVNILYRTNRELPNYIQISEYLRTLQSLYAIVWENMSFRPLETEACYDKQLLDDKLKQ